MSIRAIHGDCRDVLKTLADESVHCVVCSPPYYGLRDYGIAGQIGLEATPDAYVAELVAVFREVRRVMRRDATAWINLGDSFGAGKQLQGIPWRVAFALQADGWILRQDIIWSKSNPMPESVRDRCTKAHEYLFLLSKSPRYHYDADAIRDEPSGRTDPIRSFGNVPDRKDGNSNGYALDALVGRNKRSVWEVATQPFSGSHFAVFPTALIEPCIKAGCPAKACAACGKPWVRKVERTAGSAKDCPKTQASHEARGGVGKPTSTVGRAGSSRVDPISVTLGYSASCSCNAATVSGTVLDPFSGAGTTGLVADRLGRDAILIELNEDYSGMSRRRITDDAPLFAEVLA